MLIPREPTWIKTIRNRYGIGKPFWLAQILHPYRAQFSPKLDYPLFDGTPRPYLIATTPRSGSHFLGHAIHNAEYFGFPLEYLNCNNLGIWQYRFGTRSDLSATFAALFRMRTAPSGWFGTKAHWNQYRDFPAHDIFEKLGGFQKAIWIYRRDLLAQAVSRSMAQQTGQWISAAPRRGGKLSYDHNQIVRNARYIQTQNKSWENFFHNYFQGPLLTVVYEDILSDQKTAFESIRQFLDRDANQAPVASTQTQRQANTISHQWRERFVSEVGLENRWILEPQTFDTPKSTRGASSETAQK